MTNKSRLRILYLCTGNSCGSQMAEAFTRHLKGDQIEALSAGVAPKGEVSKRLSRLESKPFWMTYPRI